MDRLACVDVPALPLQLLLRHHPEWAGLPAAVVDEDKPQGLVLWANARARDAGVLPGARYGPALSLAPTLRAGTVSEAMIQAGLDELIDRLHRFSPDVEPSMAEPGVFWLDAGGLEPVYPSLDAWAVALRQDLGASGTIAAVVVGFRRFGTYAIARALKGREAIVFAGPADEETAAMRVPLTMVGLPPGVRDALTKLGISRVGEFVALPEAGLLKRFGPEAHAFHRFASGAMELPLNPVVVEAPVEVHLELDYQETNAERLVFLLKPLVDRLLATLSRQGRALVELVITLVLDNAGTHTERVRTAEPTLASVTVMELVRLRLTAGPLAAPVVGLGLTASWAVATAEQLAMFIEAPRRDPAAAARAFARLRAAFGDEDVVAKAVMRDRHLPEGRFAWEPMHAIGVPHPLPDAAPMLARLIRDRPIPLPGPPGRGPDGLRLIGSPERWHGPYRLTGGWWRHEIQRDYYFAELKGGELLWVFYDRVRRRWFLQGEVS